MRLPLFTRASAAILSLVTALAAPAIALAHGVEHTRIEHEDHHSDHFSSALHDEAKDPTTAVLEVPPDAEHPHYDLVSTTCGKLVPRLPVAVQLQRPWAFPPGFLTSQRFIPTDKTSWIDPPPTRTSQPRAPPRR